MSNIVKSIFLVSLLVGLVWFACKISWVIQLVIISLLIVYVLSPIVEYLKEKRKIPHLFAVIVTFFCFLLTILAFIGLVIPVLQKEIREIARDLPHYIIQIQDYIKEIADFLMAFDLGPEIMNSILSFSTKMEPLLEEVATFSISVLSSFIDIFFILFIVFYLLYDFKNIRLMIIKLLPVQYRKSGEDIISLIDRNVGNYIAGNVVRCTIVGFLTGFVLFLVGMPYSLLLGIIAGVLNIILYIGPYIAFVPALILSFSPMTPSPVIVILIYLVVQAIDGTVLSPLLLGRAVKLKPITVIISLLVGQQLAGVLGMILSTPVAGIIRSLLEYFDHDKRKVN